MKTRTPAFLMANLGSDVSQLFSHLERGERQRAMFDMERVKKIITELLAHTELKGRTSEVEILRDLISDAFSEKRSFDVSKDELEDYFLPFSLRVLQKV